MVIKAQVITSQNVQDVAGFEPTMETFGSVSILSLEEEDPNGNDATLFFLLPPSSSFRERALTHLTSSRPQFPAKSPNLFYVSVSVVVVVADNKKDSKKILFVFFANCSSLLRCNLWRQTIFLSFFCELETRKKSAKQVAMTTTPSDPFDNDILTTKGGG